MKKAITLVLASIICGTLFSQQWFAKDISLTAASGASIPDFKPAGTFIHEFNPDGVLLFGTIGHDQGYLTQGPEPGGEGGHGKADIVISKNDYDGNQLWTIIFGTNERDVLSNAIEDKYGDVIVSGYRSIAGIKHAFLAKIRVVNNSGSYSFNVDWAEEYGDWTPTDLFEIFNYSTSKGYVVVGSNGNNNYVIKSDHTGNASTGGYWAKTYNGTNSEIKLYSGLQQKTETGAIIIGGGGSGDDKDIPEPDMPGAQLSYLYTGGILTLCGTSNNEAYLVSISLNSGAVLNDKSYSAFGFSETTIYINCPSRNASVFHEIIQLEQGDLVVLGNESPNFGSSNVLMRVTKGLNNVKWLSESHESDPSGTDHTRGYDLMETDLGISVLMNTAESYQDLMIMEVSKDGDFQNVFAKEYPGVGVLDVEENYGDIFPPYMDFSVHCGINYHYTAHINKVGSSSYADNVPHIKSTPIIRYCGANEVGLIYSKCTNFYYSTDPDLTDLLQISGNLTLNPLSGLMINIKNVNQVTNCESNCTNSTCNKTTATIIVCPDGSGSGTVDLVVPGTYAGYWWSTGDRDTDRITVDDPGTYVVYVVDANDCIEAFEYTVIEAPEINLQNTMTGLSCYGANDGEICFTTNVNIVNASISYPVNGIGQSSFVTINSSSFCFSNIIPGGTGNPGLEGGTYYITVYDQYGCSDSFSASLFEPQQVEIIPTPRCEDPGMCDGSISVNITGGVGNYFIAMNRVSANGSWSNGSFMNPTLPFVYNGLCRYDAWGDLFTYTVNVFDGNSCHESYTFQVDECGSRTLVDPDKDPAKIKLTGTDAGDRMEIWPNPARSVLNLQSDEQGLYQIMNTAGQVVIQGNHNSPQSEINLEGLSPGVYIMRLGSKQEKLIITE